MNLRLPGHGSSKAPNAPLLFVGGVASQVMCSATVGCQHRIRSCLGLLIEVPVVWTEQMFMYGCSWVTSQCLVYLNPAAK